MKNICLDFELLDNEQLYQILALRLEIFVIEQECIYQDMDGKDLKCKHILHYDDKENLIAYARLIPPGLSFPTASIGRILVKRSVRGENYGRELVTEAIDKCRSFWPDTAITIGAQSYLSEFYTSFGFSAEGTEYLEDGIPHIQMRLQR